MWDVPDIGTALFPEQSYLFSSALDDLARAQAGVGLLSGGAVTPVSGRTVAVAAGSGRFTPGGDTETWTGGNVTSDAPGSVHRIDIVQVNASGTRAIKKGSTTVTREPDPDSGWIKLAALHIAPSTATFTSGHILDRRLTIAVGADGEDGDPGQGVYQLAYNEDMDDVPSDVPTGTLIIWEEAP